jgi:hypothetical protein
MMTRADWVLMVIALCALPLLYLHLWTPQDAYWDVGGTRAGARGSAVQESEPSATHGAVAESATGLRIQIAAAAATVTPLTPDRQVQVTGPIGESTIEIRAGQARFLSSPCPGQVCVHSGWLREAGQLAACLPNRISIQLLGSRLRFDATNF